RPRRRLGRREELSLQILTLNAVGNCPILEDRRPRPVEPQLLAARLTRTSQIGSEPRPSLGERAGMERKYYAVLGVPETASHEAIQEAFRRLARAYHPDVSGADTASRFREVQEAWDVLGHARQRREYDART